MAALKCTVMVFLFLLVVVDSSTEQNTNGASLIVIGASGDLARRKIWPSLRELVHQDLTLLSSLLLFAGTRNPPEKTKDFLYGYFEKLVCPEDWDISTRQCSELNDKLFNSIIPVQLSDPESYSSLQQQIETLLNERGLVEEARIFYLSVPPFAYSVISGYIHNYSRPMSSYTKLRVAIEKPFGRDLSSAKELADLILGNLNSREVFLIDHYLHKPGVSQIVEFRKSNPLLSVGLIDHIEIISSESIDVRGRTDYYDQYGVIRDMMQNHLTEILTLLTLDLSNLTLSFSRQFDLNAVKFDILQSIYSPFVQSAVFGQYSGYQDDLENDKGRNLHVNISTTPTFSVVVLHLQSPVWFDVPVIVVSGKKLGKRETIAKIVFKKTQNISLGKKNGYCNDIVFTIQDSKGSSFITLPSNHNFNLPNDKTWIYNEGDETSCKSMKMIPLGGMTPKETYASVLRSLIRGESDLFVPLSNVLESWRIWSPLLLEYEEGKGEQLMIYNGSFLDNLQLTLNGSKLNVFINSSGCHDPQNNLVSFEMDGISFTSGNETVEKVTERIFGHSVYKFSRSSLAHEISQDILDTAIASIQARDSFHLALPGGSSPSDIYQSLIVDYKHSFPWMHTSIWQTDERCVPITSRDSNLFQLSNTLLARVGVPYVNIHPLFPVCNKSETVLNDYASIDYIDYVLLGVGKDGHTASLFPDSVNSSFFSFNNNETVEFVKLPSDYPIKVKERVTLSMERLVKAKRIGMIITGKDKCHLARVIGSQEKQNSLLPFVQLLRKAKPGTVKVWMDRNICKK